MKRTNSRSIRAPFLGSDEEQNLRAYDYARRTAVPTLDDYVIGPFESTLKREAFSQAMDVLPADGAGMLLGRHEAGRVLQGKNFAVVVYDTCRVANEPVLAGLSGFLQTIIEDNAKGINREGVRKVDGAAFVFREYFLAEMERLKQENTTSFNRTDLSVKDPSTGKRAELQAVDFLQVYLDMHRYAAVNDENAASYLSAQSLKGGISGFMKEYEADARKRFDIPGSDLESSQEFDFDLSDGSGVRFLFFPRRTVEYSGVLAGIVGKTTKGIAGSTGDLDVIGELAFGDDYEYMRAGAGIRVGHESLSAHLERIVMRRFGKDGSVSEHAYRVLDNEGKVYVAAEDIQDNVARLMDDHTSNPTQFKIDFFAGIPDYLR